MLTHRWFHVLAELELPLFDRRKSINVFHQAAQLVVIRTTELHSSHMNSLLHTARVIYQDLCLGMTFHCQGKLFSTHTNVHATDWEEGQLCPNL